MMKVLVTLLVCVFGKESEYLEQFRRLDLRKDGFLDPQELRTVYGSALSEEDLHTLWRSIDVKHKGYIDIQEYIDYSLKQGHHEMMRLYLLAGALVAGMPEFDEDVDIESLGGAYNAPADELSPEVLEKQAREDFDLMDLDKNGKLTIDDIMEYLDDENAYDEVFEFITKADLDGDSSVSFEEYNAFIMDLFAEYAQEQAGGYDDDLGDFDFSQFEGLEGFGDDLDDLDDLDKEDVRDNDEL